MGLCMSSLSEEDRRALDINRRIDEMAAKDHETAMVSKMVRQAFSLVPRFQRSGQAISKPANEYIDQNNVIERLGFIMSNLLLEDGIFEGLTVDKFWAKPLTELFSFWRGGFSFVLLLSRSTSIRFRVSIFWRPFCLISFPQNAFSRCHHDVTGPSQVVVARSWWEW